MADVCIFVFCVCLFWVFGVFACLCGVFFGVVSLGVVPGVCAIFYASVVYAFVYVCVSRRVASVGFFWFGGFCGGVSSLFLFFALRVCFVSFWWLCFVGSSFVRGFSVLLLCLLGWSPFAVGVFVLFLVLLGSLDFVLFEVSILILVELRALVQGSIILLQCLVVCSLVRLVGWWVLPCLSPYECVFWRLVWLAGG